MTLALLSNLALLLSASVLYSYIYRLISENTIAGKIVIGISFGVITIVGMTFPYQFTDGLIFDGRSVIISVAALFSGSLASVFVVIVSSAYRIWLGGVGTVMGVSVIISSAVIGLLFRYFIKNYNLKLNVVILLLMGLLVHVVMLNLVFTLPFNIALTVSKGISIPVLIIFSLSTVLLGYLILDQEERRVTISKLIESEKRWQYALEGPGDGVWDWDMQTNKVLFSPQWKAMLGYTDNEIENDFEEWEKRVHPDDKQKAYEDLNKHFSGETPYYSNEHRLLCKDGSYKWVLDRGKVIDWSKDGKPLRIIGTHTDISVRKKAEEEKIYFSTLLESSLNEIYIFNSQSLKFEFANYGALKNIGYTIEEIRQLTPLDLKPEFNEERIREFITPLLNGSKLIQVFETVHQRKNGTRYNVEVHLQLMKYGDKKIFVAVILDITERKHAEEQLKKSETRYSNLFENILDGFALHEMIFDDTGKPIDYRFLEVNPAFEKMTGLNSNAILGKTILEVMPNTEQYWIDSYGKVVTTGKPIRLNNFSKEIGKYFEVVAFSPAKNHFATIFTDITDRIKAADELNKQKELAETIINNIPIMIAFFNEQGEFQFVNNEWLKLLGWSVEEIKKCENFMAEMYPDKNEQKRALDFMLKAEPRWEDFITKTKFGNSIDTSWTNVKLSDGRSIGIGQDITVRKKIEQELKNSEEQLRAFFESDMVGTLFGDIYGGIKNTNNEYLRIIGYSREELEQGLIKWDKITPPEWSSADYAGISEAREKGACTPYEKQYIRKDGSKIWVLVGYILIGDNREDSIAFILDLTKIKNYEAELQKSENELRSLAGHLQTVREEERAAIAREIHDELGQVLTTLKMNISLISREIYDSEKIDKNYLNTEFSSMVKIIDDSVIRVRKLISELRPEVLDKLGLLPALEWQVEEFAKHSGIKCSFKCNVEELDIIPDKGIVIFRVLQEALNNVGRHSQANEANIILTVDKKNVTLQISDNGKGYSKTDSASKKTFGVLGMRERAGLINAQFNIKGSSNGTTITLSIPAD